ncbi:MAG: alpha/beta fold hydrolase [Sphingomonadaceae bacterium]|nr:alpha/beta fold hydrolase [Sphingomonadaceae bacterium]
MRHGFLLALAFGVIAAPAIAVPPEIDPAVYTDPAHDAAHPARMEVIHVPVGGVAINGVVYVAAGAGPHPVVVLCHGLPGNEKNLDLAQAIRRAGWTVITFNYRGSWGSPGSYRFAQDLEDANAVIAYVRAPANAAALNADPKRIVVVGHSLGGWVTALTAAHDKAVLGAAMISPGNLGAIGRMPRATAVPLLRDNGLEALADTSPETMYGELSANADAFDFVRAAPALLAMPLLVATSDDGLAPQADALVAAIRTAHGAKVTTLHVATDHSWSDHRIRLESEVIRWLAALK